MLLLIVIIAVADVIFAFDSIPAVFGITTKPVLIVASNVFALMGLRHLYVLLIRALDRLVYLNTGLAAVCAFIGGKLILEALHDDGVRWAVYIPTWLSIAVVVAILLLTAIAGSAGQTAERRRQRLAAAANGPMSMGLLPGGLLTGSERAMLERRFAVIDTDGNGRWQRDDCTLLTQRLCDAFGHATDSGPGRAVATGQLGLFDVLLRHMDTDGNQEISREEFVTGLGQHHRGPARPSTPPCTPRRSPWSRWPTGTATGCWTAPTTRTWPRSTAPTRTRPRPPSTGSTWTATGCWTPPSSPWPSASSSLVGLGRSIVCSGRSANAALLSHRAHRRQTRQDPGWPRPGGAGPDTCRRAARQIPPGIDVAVGDLDNEATEDRVQSAWFFGIPPRVL